MSTNTMQSPSPARNGHDHEAGGTRTYRGRRLADINRVAACDLWH